jgi:hypothetical protein
MMFGVDDAIELGIGAVGLGMQVFGAFGASNTAKEEAKVSKDEALHEQNINDLKTQQMELEGRRSLLQTFRNTQRAVAMGINSAVNQGSQFGSGLLGGIADTQNQGNFNALGINQALSIGRNINTENQGISQDRMKMADLKGQEATSNAWQSLGGALMKSGGTIGNLGANLFSGFGKSSNPYYGPLNYNG